MIKDNLSKIYQGEKNEYQRKHRTGSDQDR